jgi:hypothetical protein
MHDMVGGWFVGNFEPSAHKADFEVCYKVHPKGEKWSTHYHTVHEINYLIRGQMTINGELLLAGDIFVIDPLEPAAPVFLTDCELIVVKTKSIPYDKYEVQE